LDEIGDRQDAGNVFLRFRDRARAAGIEVPIVSL
jgi:hypothetical protein